MNRTFATALAIAALVAASAEASPKGYDIERLLRQDLPAWRSGAATPAAPPPARPLERLPNVPAPAVVPQQPQAAPIQPSAPAAAPAAALPSPRRQMEPRILPSARNTLPPASSLPAMRKPAPAIQSRPTPAVAPEPVAAPTPTPKQAAPLPSARRVIQAPGAPRSTVSNAWPGER